MTITINLPDEKARRLVEDAAERGMKVEDYVTRIVHRVALDSEARIAAMRRLHEITAHSPPLPEEAFRRESMYDD